MATITTKKLGTTGLNMMEYLPTNYDASKTYPCLVFLPGAGEIGTNAALLQAHGPFLYLKPGVDLGLDLIVLAIQNINQNPRPGEIQVYIDSIKAAYKISALIGTGLSRGGQDWAWFANNAENQLKELAALVLFSSQGTVSDMPSIPGTYNPALFQKNNVVYWQGCGTMDSFYDARKAEYTALAKIAPALAIWTEWAGAIHGDPVWSDGYNPNWTKNTVSKSIYQWAASFGSVIAQPQPAPVPAPTTPPTPAPRTVTGLSITVNGQMIPIPLAGAKFTFSDGSSQ